jgi:hypothetical protein
MADELQDACLATSSLLKGKLKVPTGQAAKKVAEQKAQVDALRANAAEEQETAAPSARHEPQPLPTAAPNTGLRKTSEVGEDGISASGKSPLRPGAIGLRKCSRLTNFRMRVLAASSPDVRVCR